MFKFTQINVLKWDRGPLKTEDPRLSSQNTMRKDGTVKDQFFLQQLSGRSARSVLLTKRYVTYATALYKLQTARRVKYHSLKQSTSMSGMVSSRKFKQDLCDVKRKGTCK